MSIHIHGAAVASPIGRPADRFGAWAPWLLTSAATLLAVGDRFGLDAAWLLWAAVAGLLLAAASLARQHAAALRQVEIRRALAVSETRSRQLLENVAAGLLTVAADGMCRGANAALVRLLGFATESDLLAADFRQHLYAGPGTFDALLQRARQDGELPIVEFNVRRRDGVQLMAAATVRAVWDERGDVEGFEVTLLDISDLKIAERQRRSMERRFRRLFDSNAVGIMFGNLRRGTLDEGNDRLGELLGLHASEFPILLDSLGAQNELPLSVAVRAALEDSGHAPPVERILTRADGARIGVLICAAMIDPLQGDFIGVVVEREATSIDRTRDTHRACLHESVVDALPLLVARFDAAAKLSYCNRAFVEWFGFSSAPLGWSLEELFGAECDQALAAPLKHVLAGATESAEMDLLQVGGRPQRLSATFAPHRRADGGISGFVMLLRDHSSRALTAAIPMRTETTYTS